MPVDLRSSTDSKADVRQDTGHDAGVDAKADAKADVKQDAGQDLALDVTPDFKAEVPDEIGGEPPCVPDCGGKVCGDDGCGGECGQCVDPKQCIVGMCTCVPQCDGKECGEDGCGGACGQCDDGNVQTTDSCLDGLCVFCLQDCYCKECGDDGCGGMCGTCDDKNACTVDSCEEALCKHTVSSDVGCCESSVDCEDGNPCTDHLCHENNCLIADVPACCLLDEECDNGYVCESSWCDQSWHQCMTEKKGVAQQYAEGIECCSKDAECMAGGLWEEDTDANGLPGPDNPATLDACIAGLCLHVLFPEDCGCGPSADCPPNENICLLNVCKDDCICEPKWIPGCCLKDSDCFDSTICTDDICDVENHKCVHAPKGQPSCCEYDSQCDDGNPCNIDLCFDQQCYDGPDPTSLSCCMSDEDCQDVCAGMFGFCDMDVHVCVPVG